LTSPSDIVDSPELALGQGVDAQPRKGLSALAVDDEPGMRHFLEKALETRFARVDTAGSVEMAQALFENHDYSTIVLDVSLPGKSGLAWLNELRQGSYEGDVILITGYADMDTAIGALRAGARYGLSGHLS
jgi:DNA-binding NtrC family response regulator